MSPLTVVLSLLSVLVLTVESKSPSCRVPVGTNTINAYRWPLIFKPNGELYTTSKGFGRLPKVVVPSGDEFVISCAPNFIDNLNSTQVITTKCSDFDSSEISACDLRVIEEVQGSNGDCELVKGHSRRVGYVNPVWKKVNILADICVDEVLGVTKWIRLSLGNKKTSEELAKWKPSLLFSEYKGDFLKALHFDQLYDKMENFMKLGDYPDFSLSTLVDETLLGNEQLFSITKLGWNYVLIPDNAEVWKLLQKDISEYSKITDVDVEIAVSPYPYTLTNSLGQKMPLYLAEASKKKANRFPIPDKIFVSVNDGKQHFKFTVFMDKYSNEAKDSECRNIKWLQNVKTGLLGDLPLTCAIASLK